MLCSFLVFFLRSMREIVFSRFQLGVLLFISLFSEKCRPLLHDVQFQIINTELSELRCFVRFFYAFRDRILAYINGEKTICCNVTDPLSEARLSHYKTLLSLSGLSFYYWISPKDISRNNVMSLKRLSKPRTLMRWLFIALLALI